MTWDKELFQGTSIPEDGEGTEKIHQGSVRNTESLIAEFLSPCATQDHLSLKTPSTCGAYRAVHPQWMDKCIYSTYGCLVPCLASQKQAEQPDNAAR